MRRPVGYPENPQSLVEHLLKWRQERGLLQRDAAARMAVRLDTYITWEHGRRPSIEHVSTIVRQLGYDPTEPADGPVGEIETARRHLGWSLSKTSEFLGIDQGTLARWRAGESFPQFVGDRLDRFLALPGQHINEQKSLPKGAASWTASQSDTHVALRLSASHKLACTASDDKGFHCRRKEARARLLWEATVGVNYEMLMR